MCGCGTDCRVQRVLQQVSTDSLEVLLNWIQLINLQSWRPAEQRRERGSPPPLLIELPSGTLVPLHADLSSPVGLCPSPVRLELACWTMAPPG